MGSFARRLGLAALLVVAAAPAALAFEFEQSIEVRPGGRLEVEMDAGSVRIEGHDESVVRVEARAAGLGSVDFDLESEGDEVRLSADFGGFAAVFRSARALVLVRVPVDFSVEIETSGGSVWIEDLHGDVEVQTSGGSIELDRIVGRVELETSGGSIRADQVVGELRAQTSGGSIRGSELSGGIEAETSGGSIQLHDVGGPVRAQTSGGSISVRFVARPEGEIEVSGGGIEVELPEGVGVAIEAESSGGRVEVADSLHLAGRIESGRIEAQAFGGGPQLQLRSSGGNVVIRSR